MVFIQNDTVHAVNPASKNVVCVRYFQAAGEIQFPNLPATYGIVHTLVNVYQFPELSLALPEVSLKCRSANVVQLPAHKYSQKLIYIS